MHTVASQPVGPAERNLKMRFDLFLPKATEPKGLRNVLKRLGPTWLSSPVRRFFQAACLILFLVMFFYVCWPYGSEHDQGSVGKLPYAELFLVLDPLLSVSVAVAARTWVWSLVAAGAILLVGMVFPRGFCGYICPLGTLIDVFDWAVGGRTKQ